MAEIHKRMGKVQPRQVTIYPYGRLKQFSSSISVMAHDAVQAITAFAQLVDGAEAILRRGRFELKPSLDGKVLTGDDLVMPLETDELHLIPALEGAAKGRGKAVLGLTLLGLSFVPGVNAGIGTAIGTAGQHIGPTAAASFQQFGTQLLGRTGSLLLLAGLSEMVSPQQASPAGAMPSSSLASPAITGQGAAVPLVYGNAQITQPVVVSSGITVETIR